jgi:transposase
MLLPVDVRDWLPADHVVWFVLDAVAAMDTSAVHRAARVGGAGRAGYDPDMMLALLIYAYAGGVRSSRQIERCCRQDVAFMVISGLSYPDHATIARFRAAHDAAMVELFDRVLRLCARAGMGALGHVAIDGTKLAADAAGAAARDRDGLYRVARRLIDEAAAVDAAEDAAGAGRPDALPEALADAQQRRRVIAELLASAAGDGDRARGRARTGKLTKAERALRLADELDADAAARAAPARLECAEDGLARARARQQARDAARAGREAAAAAAGRGLPGTRPVPVEAHTRVRAAAARVDRARQRLAKLDAAATAAGTRNLTDPHCRFMPMPGGGFTPGYNAQLAVAADHLILATDVVTDTGDWNQLAPMLGRLEQAVGILSAATANPDLRVGCVLVDAGYASHDNLTATGPDRLIALGNRAHPAGEHPPTSPPDQSATARERMAWRLSTPEGRALYRKRGATVEPVHGHLKDRRGLRRFARRGITAARAELSLAALTTNLLHLFTSKGRHGLAID